VAVRPVPPQHRPGGRPAMRYPGRGTNSTCAWNASVPTSPGPPTAWPPVSWASSAPIAAYWSGNAQLVDMGATVHGTGVPSRAAPGPPRGRAAPGRRDATSHNVQDHQ
jgi:hypothetical protein